MGLPGLNAYPSSIRGLRAELVGLGQVLTCFKCRKAGTRVVYVDAAGRRWPTCRPCALAAARQPCPVCGDLEPTSVSWTPLAEGGGRYALHHRDRRVCFPLHVEERYRVPCSACGAQLRFVVAASVAIVHGTPGELRCACGAAWRLEGVARGIRVYVSPTTPSRALG